MRVRSDLGLCTFRAIEVFGRRERARDQQRGVDARQFAPPLAPTRLHVEKVVVEALVAGGIGRIALFARGQEAQRREGAFDRVGAVDEAALDANGVVSAMPVAAMLAGQSGAVLSSTRPFSRSASWMKYSNDWRCNLRNVRAGSESSSQVLVTARPAIRCRPG